MAKAIKRALAIDNRPDAKAVRRFMEKVTFAADGCWLWTGYTDEAGYGQFKWNGKEHWAHRISYLIFNGPLPDGKEMDHRCFCRRCVNPDHLRPLSIAANRGRKKATAAVDDIPF